MKYSCGYWPKPDTTFEESEVEMLNLYCQRAELQDGMKASADPPWQGRHALRRILTCSEERF
jgi:hypothetical protein